MKNPCKTCIVNACCTQVCKPKEEFVEEMINNLTIFVDEYIYDKKGYPLKTPLTPKLEEIYSKYSYICEENRKQVQNILLRKKVG
jgi:hypothetical protein